LQQAEHGRPDAGLIGVRRRQTAPAGGDRWSMAGAHRLRDELTAAGHEVALNHVYLAGAVDRHFGRLSDTGASATPGVTVSARRVSTVRSATSPPTWRPARNLAGRRRPEVLVLDTGLATADGVVAHGALRGHCELHDPWLIGQSKWDDEDDPDRDGSGFLDDQSGHGTFVAGIVRRWCPDALIHTRGVLTSFGDGDDASVAGAVARALRGGRRYDLVVSAFGGYGEEDRPTPLRRAIARLQQRGSLVVASAGNDGTSRRAFPAAFPGVVAVGGLDEDGRAPFSNFGPWIDACAPATDVISTFFSDFAETGTTDHPPYSFAGWARWSGTSFAAPYVAGVIAEELYLHGGTAVDAWNRVRSRSTRRVPDLGVAITD
jgi:subtilisin family serine protease